MAGCWAGDIDAVAAWFVTDRDAVTPAVAFEQPCNRRCPG
jgi:hypothetical protein